ncbi:SoxR reducing system RseC family protein [Aquisalimonas sp.]|uniref:SoxR reducing system RseC family protein n=1 Tax=Aquisalimonas sp. TaxID=1872621 RepID=UPI0025B9AD36|nr:SoxR reducing system RseC family protein [Aquisalimonas sp.]
MIETQAEVIDCRNGWARLRVQRQTACGRCHLQSGCGVGVLARVLPGAAWEVALASATPLAPGQRVRIGVSEQGLVSAAALVYLLPLVMLLGGAALASPWGDAATIPAALVGLVAGLAVARRLAARSAHRGKGQPVLLGPVAEPERVTAVHAGKH